MRLVRIISDGKTTHTKVLDARAGHMIGMVKRVILTVDADLPHLKATLTVGKREGQQVVYADEDVAVESISLVDLEARYPGKGHTAK